MSAQDLEQRARELLPELPPMAMTIAGNAPDAGHWYRAEQMRDYATSAIVAAIRQQPEAVRYPSYDALLLIVQSVSGALERAGLTDCDDPGEAIDVIRERLERRISELETAPHQPAPVVDDARMARALEWVRTAARGNVGEGDALRAALIESARKHLPAIEEAIAAYGPNCGARTVRVVDDELPGMWSQSDFMGGATDAADNARQPAPVAGDAMAGVLAALKDARTFVTHAHCQIAAPIGTLEKYDAATAAVNELIEVAAQIKARLDARRAKAFADRGGWQWYSREDEDDYERLCAALARAQGVQS